VIGHSSSVDFDVQPVNAASPITLSSDVVQISD
jgi:hypothetical protein